MSSANPNARLETFCDGVFAIAITLLILDMKVPELASIHSADDLWYNVARLWPSFFALCFTFVIIFIAWIGHHNLIKTVDKTSTQFQFANGFFLFTVIFMPFPTAFMAEYLDTPYAQPVIVIFSLTLILHNIGWNALYRYMLKPKPLIKASIGVDYIKKKSQGAKYGFFIYLVLAILAWWFPYTALTMNALLWVYWLYISISIKEE